METIQEIIDNKTMAIHNMVGYGGSFYYLLVLGYATEKETK